MRQGEIVYRYGSALYVNLTNRCPNDCVFCIKRKWGMAFRGHDLDLRGGEPSVPEVLARVVELEKDAPAPEIVFCGYGEPTMRLDELVSAARALKQSGHKIRLNTVGLAGLVWGKDAPAMFEGAIDSVNISLNSADPSQWEKLVRPLPQYRRDGFAAVLEFIRSCVRHVPETVVTVVDMPGVDLPAARALAEKLGAKLRARPYLEKYESS
ncbi:MAG: TatD family nuclease-associated radical SAM protein [Elusimicrobiales bacterium]